MRVSCRPHTEKLSFFWCRRVWHDKSPLGYYNRGTSGIGLMGYSCVPSQLRSFQSRVGRGIAGTTAPRNRVRSEQPNPCPFSRRPWWLPPPAGGIFFAWPISAHCRPFPSTNAPVVRPRRYIRDRSGAQYIAGFVFGGRCDLEEKLLLRLGVCIVVPGFDPPYRRGAKRAPAEPRFRAALVIHRRRF